MEGTPRPEKKLNKKKNLFICLFWRGSSYGGVFGDVGEALVVGAVDAEDGAGGDGGVDVGGAVQWVEHHDVVPRVALLHRNRHVLFLRRYDPRPPARFQAVREHLSSYRRRFEKKASPFYYCFISFTSLETTSSFF